MKKIIRLTESDLHRIIENSVKRILKEDVLGNDWHQDETDVLNNYEPFEDQFEGLPFGQDDDFSPIMNDHDWSTKGEENIDPTYYSQHNDAIGWNDDEPEGYEEDPDWYRDDVNPINDSPSDGDLYRGMW